MIDFFDPVLQIDTDTTGHADGRQKDRRNPVGTCHDGRIVHEWNVGAGLFAGPQCDVVHARHAGGPNTHRPLFRDQHHALVGVLNLESFDFLLRAFGNHALTVQFTVRAGVRLVARRQQVGRNIALSRDIGDDFDLFVDVRHLGKELSVRVAFEDVFGDGIACSKRLSQTVGVRLIEEHLGLEDFGGLARDIRIITKCQIQQNLNRRAAFHVRQQLKREGRCDFGNVRLTQDDFLEEVSLLTASGRRAGDRVVDKELKRRFAMRVAGIFDLRDDLRGQRPVINRLGVQTLGFARFDLF